MRYTAVWLMPFFRKAFHRFKFRFTLRAYTIIVLLGVAIFAVAVIASELLPSHALVETTFVATLETQSLTFRNGSSRAIISGISGSRISLHERKSSPTEVDLGGSDITKLLDIEISDEKKSKIFSKKSEESYLELDNIVIPAQRVVEVLTTGRKKFISLQVTEDQSNALSEITVVWNGNIFLDLKSTASPEEIGSKKWRAIAPLVEIEKPEIGGFIYSPMSVSAVSTDRLRLSGERQIATSSLLQGEIQFYVGSYPIRPVSLRAGEVTRFIGLDAQLANLMLTENGLRFVLVGKAEIIRTGFLTNLRDITPSVLDWVRSVPSLVIILSSLSALLLAILSAVSLGREK